MLMNFILTVTIKKEDGFGGRPEQGKWVIVRE